MKFKGWIDYDQFYNFPFYLLSIGGHSHTGMKNDIWWEGTVWELNSAGTKWEEQVEQEAKRLCLCNNNPMGGKEVIKSEFLNPLSHVTY